MPTRAHYPAPECSCGENDSSINNTYYTPDGRIARERCCRFCGNKWWTIQYPEFNMDPEQYRVVYPSKSNKSYKRKQVEITPINA